MAGFFSDAIAVDKNKKPVDVSWKSCLKMMKNPDDFMKRLIEHKSIIDQNLIPPANMKFIEKEYLSMESFKPEIQANKSAAAKGVCEWVINMFKYWSVI